MALVRDFTVASNHPNTLSLNWTLPLGFNDTDDEIIITRSTSHFPVELYNEDFPNRATDNRPVEIFRGKTIVGTNTGTISVSSNVLTDTAATFPTSPSLAGRFLRDASSEVIKIVSNTATTLTLESAPANGKYIVLPDFSTETRAQENYENNAATEVGSGYIKNLYIIFNANLQLKEFVPGELANLIFKDGNGDKFLIKNNTSDTITFFETTTPVVGVGMALLNSHFDSVALPFIDNFKTQDEADARDGTGLLNDQFYYYTAFTKEEDTNVARAEFATINSGVTTQAYDISLANKYFGDLLYSYWPGLYRELDSTEDLKDLMDVFGLLFNNLHSLIDQYRLQNADNLVVTALQPLSEQTGLPSIGYSIGIDTFRRIANEMISCWKLKGTKEGIALFIRVITTWDITNGTADFSGSIQDFLPNVEALRFFDPNLGNINTRLTQTDPFVGGGRFAQSLPGIVIPGFFTFREFVVTIPNVALYIGRSEGFSIASGTTTMEDTLNNFGATDSLVGNFLIPNTEEVNDVFEIVGNTSTTITVQGIINNRNPGGNYAILSPLNSNRFTILNRLFPVYIPFGTKAGFQFTINP